MELWYSEEHTPDVSLSIRIDRQVYTGESDFQKIDVFDTTEFGRMLTLDGAVMLTEKDEFIYHEMIVHVPMAANPDIRRVLVIGAGDGGVIRELVKYPYVEKIDLVEIDKQVVDVCRQYFPALTRGFDDPRVKLYFEDGVRFVRRCEEEYDLIIVDSTDPFGPGEGLSTREFYGSCYNAIRDNGILVNQHETPCYGEYAEVVFREHRKISKTFPVARVYQAHIPTYPSGHWLFGFASDGIEPINDRIEQWNALGIQTRYYNTELHRGCFALPNYVKDILEGC